MAAENLDLLGEVDVRLGGFNEAAAHGRGKLVQIVGLSIGERASMRPRRMAAENDGNRLALKPWTGGMASMRPRRMAAENHRGVVGPRAQLMLQ